MPDVSAPLPRPFPVSVTAAPEFSHEPVTGAHKCVSTTPTGLKRAALEVQPVRRRPEVAVKASSESAGGRHVKRRAPAPHDRISRPDVLRSAGEPVRSNKGAAGADGEPPLSIEVQGMEQGLPEARQLLESGKYRPLPNRRVYIPRAGKAQGREAALEPAGKRSDSPDRDSAGSRANFRRQLPAVRVRLPTQAQCP